MGRAGGGSRGGSRSFGGGGRSFSSGSRSFGGGGRSFSSGSGSRSFGSSGGRSSIGSSFGSFGGGHTPRPHHRPVRPIIINPGYGGRRKTVIINNGGNQTYNGTNTSNTGTNNSGPGTYTNTASGTPDSVGTTQQTYTAPKELTPEQKLARAERLSEEAKDAKQNTTKQFFVAIIIFIVGLIAFWGAKRNAFEKVDLKGTKDVGYVQNEGFLEETSLLESVCHEFYLETGIPLFFYTVTEYEGKTSNCDAYTEQLYDSLFKDENHVLIAIYDNVNWWSWKSGDNVADIMDSEEDTFFNQMEYYWDNDQLNNYEVLAYSVEDFQEKLLNSGNGGRFGVLLCVVGAVILLVGIIKFVNKGKEAKRYEEEAKTLQAEILLSKPLETFGNQEVENLKDKYDNM